MSPSSAVTTPDQRLEVLFEELAELSGQRNAIDGRIVDIVAEIDRGELWGATGARSVAGWWPEAGRLDGQRHGDRHRGAPQRGLPRCVGGMREGRLSLDQVGVIAARAADGSDEHYARSHSRDGQPVGTAVKLEPRPEPDPRPDPQASITKTGDEQFTRWRITLPHLEAAKLEAALASHRDALITEWKQARDNGDHPSESAPPMPGDLEAFLRLVEAGWDAEATRRPHGQHTTVVVHVDAAQRAAALHLGPLLSDADRRYLPVMPPARCGSNVPADRSVSVGPPARSAAGCAVPLSTATAPARFPVAERPAACTPTTSGTGRTAAPRNWPTSSCSAPTTTGCTTAASSPSPDPQTASS